VSVDNLKIVYEKAAPHDIRTAEKAFWKYQQLVGEIAQSHGFNTRVGAGVFAALSPNNDYHGNLRDAHKLIAAAAKHQSIESFSVSTWGHNKRKAWSIVHGTDPLEAIIANKTRNFFINIVDPTDPEAVTVDGHMFNMWKGRRTNLVAMTARYGLYETVAAGVRELATQKGFIPSQMQGILWLTWRRLHRIYTPKQCELWDVDYIAARLPWRVVNT
jgi:hypothetical protein